MANKMKTLDWVAIVLLIIGGINWGICGLTNFRYNLVALIFGKLGMFVTNMVYVLVGLAAIYSIYSLARNL